MEGYRDKKPRFYIQGGVGWVSFFAVYAIGRESLWNDIGVKLLVKRLMKFIVVGLAFI